MLRVPLAELVAGQVENLPSSCSGSQVETLFVGHVRYGLFLLEPVIDLEW